MNRKVTVVGGAGNVGATVARAIADKELADVVIIDIAESKARGVALDIYEACPIEMSDSRIIGAGADEAGWKETAHSDVVVITSGVPRKPGMSRDDLLGINYKIMQSVTEQIVKHSPNCIIVPVANPLDAMCQAVYRLSKFPRERVIGMAGVLDSARMRTFIAMETGVSVENIHAFVLGGRGDGRGDPEGQEEDHALLGLPAGGVRDQQLVRRRAGEAGGARCRTDGRGRIRKLLERRRMGGRLPEGEPDLQYCQDVSGVPQGVAEGVNWRARRIYIPITSTSSLTAPADF